MYESCFDEALEELAEGEEEDEPSYASHISAPPSSLPLGEGSPADTPSGANGKHRDSGTCLDMEQQTPGVYNRMTSSGRNSDSGELSFLGD